LGGCPSNAGRVPFYLYPLCEETHGRLRRRRRLALGVVAGIHAGAIDGERLIDLSLSLLSDDQPQTILLKRLVNTLSQSKTGARHG
ncbi:TPA: hypothetical protein ACGASF_006609, partial [Pseudomonas aeruginosa]